MAGCGTKCGAKKKPVKKVAKKKKK